MASDHRAQSDHPEATLDHLFRREYGKIVAHLSARYGTRHLESIEDAVQEALMKAMQSWPFSGTPNNPSGWIFRVARNHLIDQLRRAEKQYDNADAALLKAEQQNKSFMRDIVLDSELEDDQLRMIFACCHPELSRESQIILTLKLVGGFGREEIASALLKKEDAVAKSFTRARNKLKAEVQQLEVPSGADLERRIDVVLKIIYLLFNEGYSSTLGDQLIKKDISEEAIRLANMLYAHELCKSPSLVSLLALMHFHSSRFGSRLSADGEFLDLAHQDRQLWDQKMIADGTAFLQEASSFGELNEYYLQAVLAWYHCAARTYEDTDWEGILETYDTQMQYFPGPVVALNRVVALSRARGAEAGLESLATLESEKALSGYNLFYAIKAELLNEAGKAGEAVLALEKAISLTRNEVDRKHLEKKRLTLGHA